MKRNVITGTRLYVAVAGMVLLAGCTEPTLSEPNVQASAGQGAHAPDAADAMPADPIQVAPVIVHSDADTQPFSFDAPVTVDTPPSTCRIDGLMLPANAKVYAAGAYGGKEADFQIDQSGHQATTIQVAVHEPNAPVVLLLGAYEPTVWSVGWTRGTQIAAVLVTGYHRQRLTGLPAGVPVLISSYEDRGPCSYAYVGGEGSNKLNPLAREVFGRPVDVAYAARDGRAVIGALPPGAQLVTDATAKPVVEFQMKGAPPAGQAGIDAAVRSGVLRPATVADLRAWEAAGRRNGGAADIPRIEGANAEREQGMPFRSYTVLKAFAIPAGLYGAHAATFLVAPGVPAPTGEPGHSQVRFMENGQCVGATCGMR